jgi:hypothetical protein
MTKLIAILFMIFAYSFLFYRIYIEHKKADLFNAFGDHLEDRDLKEYLKKDLLNSIKKGDSDPRAYLITLTGTVLALVFDKELFLYIAAIVLFAYQLGLEIPVEELTVGLGNSQFTRGFGRLFYAVFASLVPLAVGLLLYWILIFIFR